MAVYTLLFTPSGTRRTPKPSSQHNRGYPVILRHIADDHFVPRLQTALDLDQLHRGRAVLAAVAQRHPREKAIAALVVLREKVIRPMLASAQEIRPSRGSQ